MKIGMISLGCPKNLVDSEVMLGLAQQAGHELTQDPADADVLVVNTCAFIDSAKKESIDTILEMAQHKKDGSAQRLVVTGCLAERYRDELKTEIPEIDAILGTGEVPDIVAAIGGVATRHTSPLTFFRPTVKFPEATLQNADPEADARAAANTRAPIPGRHDMHTPAGFAGAPTYIYDANTPRIFATPRHYAFVKIAEGCDYKCAFCIIPKLRGAYRSRPAESIVDEARALAARGVKELLLISQDTTFYGIDRGERGALARLLRALNEVDGIEWIRLHYLYPTTIDDDTLAAMAECQKVCNYIDLPLQHASNPVLKRMKRPGSRQKYDQLLGRIRDRVPGVSFRTTFIVGFPGETEADVAELSQFITEHEFDHVGVFTYSHEEGTSAFGLEDDVPDPVKTARRNALMRLQKKLVRARQKRRIGQRARIVVDGPASDHELVLRGRLSTQAPDIDASVYLTECDPSAYRPGDFVEVEIVGARDYDLMVRPVG
ncbi:MAG TPA: 30S ribosomal protein S12 methylthiotransferase RimO [Vicinamibacterales bacterium]|nr:30S ribosomal protein S12 methylthiotransferase RimO [Vicinamibacterales bacterium]